MEKLARYPVTVADAFEFTGFKLQHGHELAIAGVVGPLFYVDALVDGDVCSGTPGIRYGGGVGRVLRYRFAETVFQHRLTALLQDGAFGVANLRKVALAAQGLSRYAG